jgi:hypothetical protein
MVPIWRVGALVPLKLKSLLDIRLLFTVYCNSPWKQTHDLVYHLGTRLPLSLTMVRGSRIVEVRTH